MEKIKDKIIKFFKSRYTILTLLIIVMYIIYLIIINVVPFGDKTILKSDAYQQYLNFFCYFREVLLHGKSLLMSWNLGLGNNFLTTFAYYLASPLNLLVVFFKPENMYWFVELITLIKLILIGNFFMLFLSKSYQYKKRDTVLFGLMYTFSAYVMSYAFHIMWLDAVYMLPIVLIFVDKYIKTKKIYPYILALAYTLYTSYYIGFMVAFFSGIYYLAKYFIEIKGKFFTKGSILKFIKSLFKFLLGIVISFGLIMFLFIPSLIQLSGNMIKDPIKLFDFDIDKIRLFFNVIFNNYNYLFEQKSCLVFSGTLTLLLLPTYYMNSKISKKEKIFFSLVVIFLLLPIISPFMDKMWHGFARPNCFNYRYSFALSFMLILMAFRAYQNRTVIKKKHLIISGIIFFILTAIEIIIKKLGYLTSDNYEISYSSIMLSCVTFVIMWIIFSMQTLGVKRQQLWTILLVIIVCFDLGIGMRHSAISNDKYFSEEHVTKYDKPMEELLKYVDNKETDRIVFIPDNFGSNMSLKYGYSDIGYFTSARNRATIENMYKLGYNIQRDEQLWITSFSGTYFNYTLAGVKYYITAHPLEENEIYGFKLIDTIDGYYLYENENTIPFGYFVNENITEAENPFEMQNEILSSMGKNNSGEKYMEPIQDAKDLLSCTIDEEENDGEIKWKYKVTAKKDTNLYLYSDWELQLYKDGEPQFEKYADLWSTEAGIKGIKHLNEGESYEFEIGVDKETYDPNHNIYIYATDNEKIKERIQNLNQDENKFSMEKIEKNALDGKATVTNESYLVLPISYDDGWRATVNGEKVEVKGMSNVFCGIELEPGEYEIHLYFIPRGFKLGLLLSTVSILMFIGICIFEKGIKKDDKKNISKV